jgi:putative Mn2+ efflux pump MntP
MKDYFRGRRLLYGLILFFITLSGFAQMPIFARYYISDIPGLGWLAQFYVTHAMHYIMAALLLALGAYALLDAFLNRKQRPSRQHVLNRGRLTATGWVKLISLAGLGVTGCFMVVKNLPGVYFSHNTIILLDLSHLFFCMVLLGATFYSWVRQKTWVTG